MTVGGTVCTLLFPGSSNSWSINDGEDGFDRGTDTEVPVIVPSPLVWSKVGVISLAVDGVVTTFGFVP